MTHQSDKSSKKLATLFALILGVLLIGYAVGYESTWFKIIIGLLGINILFNVFFGGSK